MNDMSTPVRSPARAPMRRAGLDNLERRSPALRLHDHLSRLPAQVTAALRTPAFAETFAGVVASEVRSMAALASLPVTRKSELLERQKAQRAIDPLGGYSNIGWRSLRQLSGARRVFQSPGPIYEPEGQAPDHWRVARAMAAAGFEAGDLIHNSFSYHLTPAGAMMESGAHALGCTVLPAGVGNTELQLDAMVDLRPDGYVGTPSFLRILLERAAESQRSIGFLTKALVGGEACPPSLRDWFGARGVETYQCYATADIGLIAYETEAREGLVLDEGVIVEIVRPGTGDPVPDGEVGEVVVTVLQPDYPLVRFGTGDLSAILPGACPSGRTNRRIRGWLGRADQTAKVRGMFVHPSQVAEALRRHPEAARARLVIEGELAQDHMTLRVEAAAGSSADLAAALGQTMRELTKLRCDIETVTPGSLPNDGKVIEDLRKLV
jgi:phenylacetate-CoA ligase